MAARLLAGRPSKVARLALYARAVRCDLPKRALSVTSAHWTPDKLTHTGQFWEEDDYRNIRFTDRTKQVNEQFAIDLLAEEPVVLVRGGHTWCDGGRGALGHPKVYINLDRPEIADCGYCGKRFLQEKHKELFENEQFTHKK